MAKEMTHIGTVTVKSGGLSGRQVEKWLRATPKFWTDGEMKWPKLNRYGEPNTTASVKHRHSYAYHILDLTSIRPLTLEEKREPLQTQLRNAEKIKKDLQQRIKDHEKVLAIAERQYQECAEALAAFDIEHGVVA